MLKQYVGKSFRIPVTNIILQVTPDYASNAYINKPQQYHTQLSLSSMIILGFSGRGGVFNLQTQMKDFQVNSQSPTTHSIAPARSTSRACCINSFPFVKI